MENYRPGFALHPVQARLTAQSPWGWRPAIVTGIDGGSGTAVYLHDDGTVAFWHHRPLDVEPGAPVRVHEELGVLEIVDAWLSVRVDAGVGAVPVPEDPALWAGEACGVIVNAATGDGIRISPEVARRLRQKP